MCIYVQDMKFLWFNLLPWGLSTNDANDDANDNNDATRRTIHDCIGSSAISKWANKNSDLNAGTFVSKHDKNQQ